MQGLGRLASKLPRPGRVFDRPDSLRLLREAARDKNDINGQNANYMLGSLWKQGFFESAEPEDLSLLLEIIPSEFCPLRTQNAMHRQTLGLLGGDSHPLRKVGIAQSLLSWVGRGGMGLKVEGLYLDPLVYVAGEKERLSTSEWARLFVQSRMFGRDTDPLPLHPYGQIELELKDRLVRPSSFELSYSISEEVMWSLLSARYHGLKNKPLTPIGELLKDPIVDILGQRLLGSWRGESSRLGISHRITEIVFLLHKAGWRPRGERATSNWEKIIKAGKKAREKTRGISPLQLDVLAVARVVFGREAVLSEEIVVSELGMRSDVFIPSMGLVLEVDGNHHQIMGGRKTARTLLRNGLLREAGLSLATIDAEEWNKIKGLEKKMEKISAFGRGGEGVN